jgi:MFS transporter, DHA1 family, tetracycline resistance protein
LSDSVTTVSKSALITLLATMFVNMIGFGLIVPLLPFYAESFHAASWQVALIFSGYSVGSFFGEPFWGKMSDRIGRRPVLIFTVASNAALYLGLAFAPSVAIAFFMRLLGGLAGGNSSVTQSYIADVTPEEERSGRMAWVAAVYNLGFIIGPAVGGWLARPELGPAGFRVPLFAASSLSLICATGLFLFVRESRSHKTESALQLAPHALALAAARHPVIIRLLLVTLLGGSAFGGVESMFGLWAQARFHWGPHQVGSAFAVVGTVAAFCQLILTGPLSRRFGQARVLAAGMALTVVGFVLQPFSHGGWETIPLLALAAFGQAVAWPNVAALISRNIDHQHLGQYLGLNGATYALSRLLGPLFLGLSFSILSVNAPFWLATMLVAPAIALAWSARLIYTHPASAHPGAGT